jgi:hypothetical protein
MVGDDFHKVDLGDGTGLIDLGNVFGNGEDGVEEGLFFVVRKA